MKEMPDYNLSAIDFELDPEELDGMDIVKWIDERWDIAEEYHR